MGTAATTAAPADDDVEARRKRARKRAANNATRSRVSPKTTGKKKFQRRRRQTPTDQNMTPNMGGTDPLALGDRIKTMWLSFVDNVTDVVQQVRQKISDTASSTG